MCAGTCHLHNHHEHIHHDEVVIINEQANNGIHGITCSLSCNHEEHERTGFATTEYVNFSKDSVYDQVDDAIQMYIDLQGTMF